MLSLSLSAEANSDRIHKLNTDPLKHHGVSLICVRLHSNLPKCAYHHSINISQHLKIIDNAHIRCDDVFAESQIEREGEKPNWWGKSCGIFAASEIKKKNRWNHLVSEKKMNRIDFFRLLFICLFVRVCLVSFFFYLIVCVHTNTTANLRRQVKIIV